MRAAQADKPVAPYVGIGFREIGALLGTFTPERPESIAARREPGPVPVAEPARQLGRDDKNVHADKQQLIEWLAVERGDDGRVRVPSSEIVVALKLSEPVAA